MGPQSPPPLSTMMPRNAMALTPTTAVPVRHLVVPLGSIVVAPPRVSGRLDSSDRVGEEGEPHLAVGKAKALFESRHTRDQASRDGSEAEKGRGHCQTRTPHSGKAKGSH